jgi:NTE family protein
MAIFKNSFPADAVFEGGGVKGIGLIGAVAVAEEIGYHWVNLAGTSAGAIVAALLAAGYRAAELKEILTELDYRRFKDASPLDKIPVLGPLGSLIFEKGIYEGRFLESFLGDLLARKGVNTFGDLVMSEYQDDTRYRYRLRVVASDISRNRLLVLPQDIVQYGVRPDELSVARAVRMSMSIPFFYEPVKLHHAASKQTSYVVDGGLLSNFPVWLFDSDTPPEWPTFGFKLVEPETAEGVPNQIKGPISMLGALVSTMTQAHDARYIKDADFDRTVAIPTLGVGTTEFDLSRERSDALFDSGRAAARKFFAGWDFPAHVRRYRSAVVPPSRHARLRAD